MDENIGDILIQSMEDAIAYVRGHENGSKTHTIEVADEIVLADDCSKLDKLDRDRKGEI